MKYKIIVDKQPKTNPSEEKREYEIDIEELRCKGDIYDSLVITKDEDYVIRRLSLSKYGVLNILNEPQKEILENINIELFEGDNYIYLVDLIGNKFYAEYLVKNDFTDTYATINQMNSAINQTAQGIELNVNQKLEGYSTIEEMNSAIEIKANEINNVVSKKVGEDEICSKISQSADEILLEGNRILIKSDNFKLDKNGNIECSNAIITGGKIDLAIETEGEVGDKDTLIRLLANIAGYGQFNTELMGTALKLTHSRHDEITSETYIEAGGIITPELTQTSLKSKKKNIKKLDIDAVELVKNADICLYNLKGEKKGTKKHIGLVIGEGYNCPNEVISEDGQGVEQYSLTSLLYKAFQQLLERVEKLEKEVHHEKN